MTDSARPALRVGALFSERTDLVRALADLAAADRRVALVAAATDRRDDPATIPQTVEPAVACGVHVHAMTIHLVGTGVDTGPILKQAARHFPKPETASAVRAALAPIERQELGEVVAALAHGRVLHDATTGRWDVGPPSRPGRTLTQGA